MHHLASRTWLPRAVLAGREAESAPVPGGAPGAARPSPRIRAFGYGPDQHSELDLEGVAEIAALIDRWPVLWIDIDGVPEAADLAALAALLALHPLAVEDAARGDQRPKVEIYPEHWFLVLRMLSLDNAMQTEQLSVFLTQRLVVTLQGGIPGDCLDRVRARLRAGSSRLRERGADHLAYTISDAVVDSFFPVLDAFGERLEALEGEVLLQVSKSHAAAIQATKHDLFTVRRALWPLRDALGVAHREESPFIGAETRLHFRDVYDHASQLGDVLDTFREITSGLMEIHLSAVNNRMNEIMKFLTVVSMIFSPLTFIAGVYGMNFDPTRSPYNMPELEWTFGYLWALGLMVVTATSLLLYFRSRRFFE